MVVCSVFGWLEYLDDDDEEILPLIGSIAAAVLLAVLIGWLLTKMIPLAVIFLGAIIGVFVGFTLYEVLLAGWLNHIALLVLVVAGFSILGAWLSGKYRDEIMIYGTAFIGAYALIRGVGFFIGNFPNETLLIQEIAQGLQPTLDYYFYGYLVAIIIFTIIGAKYQIKVRDEDDMEDAYKKVTDDETPTETPETAQ